MTRRKLMQLAVVTSVISAAGCAPVSFAPGMGFGIGVGPSLTPSLSSCPLLGGSSMASRLGLSSATQIGEMRNRVAAVQAEYMHGANDPRNEMQSWKKLATGECR